MALYPDTPCCTDPYVGPEAAVGWEEAWGGPLLKGAVGLWDLALLSFRARSCLVRKDS